MSMRPWQERWAFEEANHFNPAYCGALIFEFVRAYQGARKVPPSFASYSALFPLRFTPLRALACRARLGRSSFLGLRTIATSGSDSQTAPVTSRPTCVKPIAMH